MIFLFVQFLKLLYWDKSISKNQVKVLTFCFISVPPAVAGHQPSPQSEWWVSSDYTNNL